MLPGKLFDLQPAIRCDCDLPGQHGLFQLPLDAGPVYAASDTRVLHSVDLHLGKIAGGFSRWQHKSLEPRPGLRARIQRYSTRLAHERNTRTPHWTWQIFLWTKKRFAGARAGTVANRNDIEYVFRATCNDCRRTGPQLWQPGYNRNTYIVDCSCYRS